MAIAVMVGGSTIIGIWLIFPLRTPFLGLSRSETFTAPSQAGMLERYTVSSTTLQSLSQCNEKGDHNGSNEEPYLDPSHRLQWCFLPQWALLPICLSGKETRTGHGVVLVLV